MRPQDSEPVRFTQQSELQVDTSINYKYDSINNIAENYFFATLQTQLHKQVMDKYFT